MSDCRSDPNKRPNQGQEDRLPAHGEDVAQGDERQQRAKEDVRMGQPRFAIDWLFEWTTQGVEQKPGDAVFSIDDFREKYRAPQSKANDCRSETLDWLQSPSRVFIHEHG